MSLRVCILGSGSSGNCTYIGYGQASILIDAGLSARETVRRLGEIGVAVESIQGICVSHEHQDHIVGLRLLHCKYGIPIYANGGTIEGIEADPKFKEISWRVFTSGAAFSIGDFFIEPFSVPHDAYDPVGFVVSVGEARIGIVTDVGVCTSLMRERLKKCHAVIIESNHDEQMLKEAQRPWALKQRIMGRQGHLSNQHAAATLAEIASPTLSQVFLAHLSEDCNRHDLAQKTTERSLFQAGHTHVKVSLTYPDRVSEMWSFANVPQERIALTPPVAG